MTTMLDLLRVIWDVIQGLLLIGLWGLLYLVVKQQGRLLLRLDRIERVLSGQGSEPAEAPGLAVGSTIPEFELADLEGRMVSSRDDQNRRMLLVHWGPGCGFCEQIAPDLARLERELAARGVRLVLVSRDDPASNRELAARHGLACPILVMGADHPLAEGPFRNQGTPVAYLIDGESRIARPLAVGGEAILALIEEVLGESGSPASGPCPRAGSSGTASRPGPPRRGSDSPDSRGRWSTWRITGANRFS
jgi:thiol-disulfide isomerase/thioredoxin